MRAKLISYDQNGEDTVPPKTTELDDLKKRAAELEKELELKNKYISHLERTISEITPLRRHIRRQLKTKLRKVDERITNKLNEKRNYQPKNVTPQSDLLAAAQQADRANFKQYNQASKRTLSLSLYLLGRKAGIGVVSRALRFGKV